MFYQQPPVGNPVLFAPMVEQETVLRQFFSPWQAKYFNSGTAALAAAITVAIRSNAAIEQPEVLVPAYGCPDLVSAAIYAGARPILVDLEPDRPWMDLEQLHSNITDRTVAVVAASLFGIAERISQVRSIVDGSGVLLIEDSAQAFPSCEDPDFWQGDLVVLSFGRGKPVSLLGGGAVLCRSPSFGDLLPTPSGEQNAVGWTEDMYLRLKVAIYNRMISPRLYWLPQSLPFLHLGETRFHPLSEITAIDPVRKSILPSNIDAYQKRDQAVQREITAMIREVDAAAIGMIDLPTVCEVPLERKLLRYPLMVEISVRNQLFDRLMKAGLGPSRMYPAQLKNIPGVPGLFDGQGPFTAAESFAQRILTLPTHSGMGAKDIADIHQTLNAN